MCHKLFNRLMNGAFVITCNAGEEVSDLQSLDQILHLFGGIFFPHETGKILEVPHVESLKSWRFLKGIFSQEPRNQLEVFKI